MINTSSAPSQQEFSNTNSQAPQDDSSNRLWIILLIVLSVIIGFWLGFFINEYFYQNPGNEADSTNLVDELVVEPARDQVVEQQDSEIIEGVEGTGEEYIIFQEQNYGTGETISFPSGNECLKNLNLVIEDIQEDMITFQIEEFASTVHEDPNEAGDGCIWGDFKDPSCFSIRSSCEDTLFEYCFYMTHADGLHYLNYDLGEQRSSESLIRTLEL